jgi:hypothetical protein
MISSSAVLSYSVQYDGRKFLSLEPDIINAS